MQCSSSSSSHVSHTFQTVLHGIGMLFMFAVLAGDKEPLVAKLYDWLQLAKQTLLTLS